MLFLWFSSPLLLLLALLVLDEFLALASSDEDEEMSVSMMSGSEEFVVADDLELLYILLSELVMGRTDAFFAPLGF